MKMLFVVHYHATYSTDPLSQVFKWHGVIYAPCTTRLRHNCVLKCVSRLCATLHYMCWHCVADTVTGLREDVDGFSLSAHERF